MDLKEAQIRLKSIAHIIEQSFNKKQPMLISSAYLLDQVRSIALGLEENEENVDKTSITTKKKPNCITISCNASFRATLDKHSAVGVVVKIPNERSLELSQRVFATSNDQVEYDAIYFGLTSLMNLKNNPRYEIEVHSDSLLVINQLNRDTDCDDEKLRKKRDLIRELIKSFPPNVVIKFLWKPRNSTPELELANDLTFDLV